MNVLNFLLGIIVVLVPIALLFLFVGYIFYTTKALNNFMSYLGQRLNPGLNRGFPTYEEGVITISLLSHKKD